MLVAIHAVDYDAVGLGDFGHPDGYLERQVRRWGEQWERSKTRELPAIDELARRLRAALPDVAAADDRARRLPPRQHDARARRPGPDRRRARLGDGDARRPARRPRAVPPVLGARRERRPRGVGATIDADAGLPDARRGRRALRRSSRAATSSQLDFYEVLASYKLAIILEGIHARFLMGKTLGEGFEHIGDDGRGDGQGALDQASNVLDSRAARLNRPRSSRGDSCMGVLDGVKVLEVAEHGFVPSAAAILADWGADVVKVERPTGDPLRHYHGDGRRRRHRATSTSCSSSSTATSAASRSTCATTTAAPRSTG